MENGRRAVVGTIERVNSSGTEDIVQVDMSQLCVRMCVCV